MRVGKKRRTKGMPLLDMLHMSLQKREFQMECRNRGWLLLTSRGSRKEDIDLLAVDSLKGRGYEAGKKGVELMCLYEKRFVEVEGLVLELFRRLYL